MTHTFPLASLVLPEVHPQLEAIRAPLRYKL